MDYVKLLATKHLGDREIDEEEPFQIPIGPERRILTVHGLPLAPWERFQRLYALFLLTFLDKLQEYEWPEWDDYTNDKKLQRFMGITMAIGRDRKMRGFLMRIVKETLFRDLVNRRIPWWRRSERKEARDKRNWIPPRRQGMSFRYFCKHVTINQVVQLFLALYLYNVEAVKKNAALLAKRLGVNTERWLSSSTRDLGGLQDVSIRPRFQNLCSSNSDGWSQTYLNMCKEAKEKGLLKDTGGDPSAEGG